MCYSPFHEAALDRQFDDMLNWPVAFMAEIVRVVLAVFVSVTVARRTRREPSATFFVQGRVAGLGK